MHPLSLWLVILLPLIFMVRAVKKRRNESETDLSKQDVLRTAFLVWAVGIAMFYIGLYLLFNHVDPSLYDLQHSMMEKMTGEKVNRADLEISALSTVKMIAFMMLPGMLFSLMISYFVKK